MIMSDLARMLRSLYVRRMELKKRVSRILMIPDIVFL